MKITVKEKDLVLQWLLNNATPGVISSMNFNSFHTATNVDFQTLDTLLAYFSRLGFVSNLNCRQVAISFAFTIEGSDFMQRGGFYAQEELLANNIKKLLLELDQLKQQLSGDALESADRLSNISTAVMNGFALAFSVIKA